MEIDRIVEGTHIRFLRQITGKQARRTVEGMWVTPKVEVVQESLGSQSVMAYIGRTHETVAQWMEMCPIFDVCENETGYEGEGKLREPWWRQEAEEKQLGAR